MSDRMFNRTLLAVALIVSTIGVSGLSAPAVAQSTRPLPAATGHAAPKYWLSDGLNRLVFWKLPAGNRPVANPAHRRECPACS